MNTLLTWTAAGLLAGANLAHATEPSAPEATPAFSAGLTVQPGTSASDIGLPLYPGATPLRDKDVDGPGASIKLWGGAFGLQLHALKLRTPDAVDSVARFYRDALVSQGRLIDCSAGAPAEPPPPATADGKLLRCEGDRARPGSRLYKLGLPGGVRMVAIEPFEGGSRVQLVRLMLRGTD